MQLDRQKQEAGGRSAFSNRAPIFGRRIKANPKAHQHSEAASRRYRARVRPEPSRSQYWFASTAAEWRHGSEISRCGIKTSLATIIRLTVIYWFQDRHGDSKQA
jgi:hypothetical protein